MSDRVEVELGNNYPMNLLRGREQFEPDFGERRGQSIGPPARRKVVRVVGNNFGPRVTYHHTCLATGAKALLERVFFVRDAEGNFSRPPTPEFELPEGVRKFHRLYRVFAVKTTPITAAQVAGTYTGRRGTKYQRAAQEFDAGSAQAWNARVSAFVKVEKVLKAGAVPRVIQARNPVYNINIGRFMKLLEPVVYKCINRVGLEMIGDPDPIIIKGFNAEEIGAIVSRKWHRFKNPRGIDLDHVRMDEHCHAWTMANQEHPTYLCHYDGKDREEFAELLELQLENVGYLRTEDGTIRYVVIGNRMSGDLNTALGNSDIVAQNLLGYLWEIGVKAALGVNGDDAFIICEAEDEGRVRAGIEAYLLRRGYRIELGTTVSKLEQLEFCQTRPVWTPTGYVMVRNYPTALAKDHTCTSERDLRKWLRAVGECGLSLTGGIPIYQEVYTKMVLAGTPSKMSLSPSFESGFSRLAVGMRRKYQPVHYLTRVSFWEAFGVDPQEQVAIEQSLVDYTFGVIADDISLMEPGVVCRLRGE